MSRAIPDMSKIIKLGDPSNATSQVIAKASAANDANEVTVREAFSDMTISDRHLQLVAQQRASILRSYAKTVEETLRVGEYLIELKEHVPGYVFSTVLDSGILPFQRRWAEKVMDVVWARPRFRAAIGESFDEKRLPSISVCYELCKLKDTDLQQAAEQGLLQGSPKPEDVASFKEKVVEHKATGALKPGAAALRDLNRMERELAKVDVRAVYLRNQIAKLERILNRSAPIETTP